MKSTKAKKPDKTTRIPILKTRQRVYKPRKYVTTWIKLVFNKNSKPVCEGEFLTELLRVVEQINKANQTISKTR